MTCDAIQLHKLDNNLHILEPGLHIVAMIADHACDYVSKRIFKLSTHRLQIDLVKYE